MKKQLYLILIIIIVGLSYLKFGIRTDYQIPLASTTPSQSTMPSPSIFPLQVFTTDYFTLSYAANASASAISDLPDSRDWRILYMGESQKASGRTQTELADGYLVSISRFEAIGDDLAMTQAQTDRQSVINDCGSDKATLIKDVQLGKYATISYYGGCLGEGTHYYLVANDVLYRITTMVLGTDEDKVNYQQSVDSILTSLNFIN